MKMSSKKQRNAQKRLDEMMRQNQKSSRNSLIIAGSIISVVLVVVAIVVINIMGGGGKNSTTANQNDTSKTDQTQYPRLDKNAVWNDNMVYGDKTAKNHFVEYSDIFCPYCAKFSKEVWGHMSEMKQNYLDNKQFFLEFRLTDFLTRPGEPDKGGDNSTRAAEHVYCAAHQKQFWPYYEALIDKIDQNYFSKGIGAYHGAPEIPVLDNSFYVDVAKDLNLNMSQFQKCIDDKVGYKDVKQATQSAQSDTGNKGLPYFRFNQYTSAGFNNDWSTVQKMFAAGLKG
jgi:protein-disulfide isomerase